MVKTNGDLSDLPSLALDVIFEGMKRDSNKMMKKELGEPSNSIHVVTKMHNTHVLRFCEHG